MAEYGSVLGNDSSPNLPTSIHIQTQRSFRSRLSEFLSLATITVVGLLIGAACLYNEKSTFADFSKPSHEIVTDYLTRETLASKSKDMLTERLEILSSRGESMTEAALAAHIDYIPGLLFEPNFLQFSGFLDIGDSKRIFYWMVESQGDPANDPVVFWTNGGPGCSGLLGFLMEMGPYRVNAKLELYENPDAWNKIANMVYIEQPAGVGFSYADDENEYYTGDDIAAQDNTKLIQEFLTTYPHFKHNDIYLTAESYGGHYLPMWASSIVKYNKAIEDPEDKIRFKGFMVGNPFTNINENMYGMYNTFWGHQLIPWTLYNKYNSECLSNMETDLEALYAPHCYVYENLIWSMIDGINPYALDYDNCHLPAEDAFNQQRQQMLEYVYEGKFADFVKGNRNNRNGHQLADSNEEQRRVLKDEEKKVKGRHGGEGGSEEERESKKENNEAEGLTYDPCIDDYLSAFLNQADVRDAIHVSRDKKWKVCTDVLHWNWGDYYDDMVVYYEELLNDDEDLKIMVYSGDDDSVCGTMGTQKWLFGLAEEMGLEREADWHKWFYHGEVAGSTVKWEKNLHFATVHHAGHEVPAYKPGQAFKLFEHYLTDKPLESELSSTPTH